MNKVFFSGNLARDVEVRYTRTGKATARTVIAVSNRTKNPDGTYGADFFDLTAWEKTAEFMGKWLKKGSRVVVECRAENDNYEKDGVKHYGIKFVVENVEFGDSKKKDSAPPSYDDDEVDVPF